MKYLSLDELHEAEAAMLRWLDKICRDENINLCLSGGTLLGSIRHRGFIPWDDDIDLMLSRPDYDRLINVVERINDERYKIVSLKDEKTILAFAKLIDTKIYIEKEGDEKESTDNLWIDIFPVDGLPDELNKVKKVYSKARFYRMALRVSMSKDLSAGSLAKRLIKPFVILPAKIVGGKRWLAKLDKLCRRIPFGSTGNVGVLCAGYGAKESMPYSEWINYTEAEFEGDKYYVPGCWEYYLTRLYGDYMVLPPEEKRHTHNIKAYTNRDISN